VKSTAVVIRTGNHGLCTAAFATCLGCIELSAGGGERGGGHTEHTTQLPLRSVHCFVAASVVQMMELEPAAPPSHVGGMLRHVGLMLFGRIDSVSQCTE
jgi:hypothetical protein